MVLLAICIDNMIRPQALVGHVDDDDLAISVSAKQNRPAKPNERKSEPAGLTSKTWGEIASSSGRLAGSPPAAEHLTGRQSLVTPVCVVVVVVVVLGGLASSAPHHQEDERASPPGHLSMGTEQCAVAF